MSEYNDYKKIEVTKECNNDKNGLFLPKPVVSIPEDAYESRIGRLFVGSTDFLTFDHDCYAWAGLVNPCGSCVNLFINDFTISNFTKEAFVAQIWFNAKLPECSQVSNNVSSENTALCPLPKPKVELRYGSQEEEALRGGVNPFLRIAEPHSTLVAYQNGNQIIPPGGTYILVLKSYILCNKPQIAKLVLGWWEERIQ